MWGFITYVLGPGSLIIPGVLGLSHSMDHDIAWASVYIAISKAVFAFSVAFAILGITNGVGGKLISHRFPIIILFSLTVIVMCVHF